MVARASCTRYAQNNNGNNKRKRKKAQLCIRNLRQDKVVKMCVGWTAVIDYGHWRVPSIVISSTGWRGNVSTRVLFVCLYVRGILFKTLICVAFRGIWGTGRLRKNYSWLNFWKWSRTITGYQSVISAAMVRLLDFAYRMGPLNVQCARLRLCWNNGRYNIRSNLIDLYMHAPAARG